MSRIMNMAVLSSFCRKRTIRNVSQNFEDSMNYQYARACIYKGFEYGQVAEGSV